MLQKKLSKKGVRWAERKEMLKEVGGCGGVVCMFCLLSLLMMLFVVLRTSISLMWTSLSHSFSLCVCLYLFLGSVPIHTRLSLSISTNQTTQLRTIRREVKQREKRAVGELVRGCDVVLATCVGSYAYYLRYCQFDVVVVDEAAQALEVSGLACEKWGICFRCDVVGVDVGVGGGGVGGGDIGGGGGGGLELTLNGEFRRSVGRIRESPKTTRIVNPHLHTLTHCTHDHPISTTN